MPFERNFDLTAHVLQIGLIQTFMEQGNIERLLRLINCQNIRRKPDWVMASCPFSWLHSGGKDSSPSFGVRVNNDGPSGYNCFGCHRSGGSLVDLLNTLNQNTSFDYNEAFDFVLENGNGGSDLEFEDPAQSWTSFGDESPEINDSNLDDQRESYFTLNPDDQPSVHPDALEKFEACEKHVHDYLLGRGFRKDVCIDWGVRVETNRCGSERVVLPVYNYENDLVAYTRRVTWNEPTCQVCGYQGSEMSWHGDFCPECDTDYDRWFVWPKYQHSKGFNRNYLLYGEHLIDESNSKGVVVEGNLDAMRLYQYGVENVVAVMGSKVGQTKPGHQMYRLGVHFDELLIMADGDEAGRDMADTITEFYQSYPDKLDVVTYVCPDGRDPGDMDRKKVQNTLDKLGFYS